jgi:hypothetical protein
MGATIPTVMSARLSLSPEATARSHLFTLDDGRCILTTNDSTGLMQIDYHGDLDQLDRLVDRMRSAVEAEYLRRGCEVIDPAVEP